MSTEYMMMRQKKGVESNQVIMNFYKRGSKM